MSSIRQAGLTEYSDSWKNRRWLYEHYWSKGWNMSQIAEEVSVARSTVHRHLKINGIPKRESMEGVDLYIAKQRFKDKDYLSKQYHEQNKSVIEISEEIGVEPTTLYGWFDELDINRRKPGSNSPPSGRDHPDWQEYASYYWYRAADDPIWKSRESWGIHYEGETTNVRVHRLIAVAEYGFDAVCGKDVHHENGIPLDNRPDNLELVDNISHHRKHTIADELQEVVCNDE